jgi:tetratricopeptide repeat protein
VGALPLYRRALEGRELVLGVEHPDTLTSVNNLAVCMAALGDAAGALPLYRRVLGKRSVSTPGQAAARSNSAGFQCQGSKSAIWRAG